MWLWVENSEGVRKPGILKERAKNVAEQQGVWSTQWNNLRKPVRPLGDSAESVTRRKRETFPTVLPTRVGGIFGNVKAEDSPHWGDESPIMYLTGPIPPPSETIVWGCND